MLLGKFRIIAGLILSLISPLAQAESTWVGQDEMKHRSCWIHILHQWKPSGSDCWALEAETGYADARIEVSNFVQGASICRSGTFVGRKAVKSDRGYQNLTLTLNGEVESESKALLSDFILVITNPFSAQVHHCQDLKLQKP